MGLTNATLFLIQVIFQLCLTVLSIRLILAWVRASVSNPITQVVVQLTQPVVSKLRRVIPTYAHVEYATLALMMVLEFLRLVLMMWVSAGAVDFSMSLFLFSLILTIKLILNTFFYAILFFSILSWVQLSYSPVVEILYQMASPILNFFRRFIPLVGGFDLSPIPALIIIQLILILL